MATDAVQTRRTRIVCISDTHNNTPKLPAGDILIHAGDLTNQGSYDELERTVAWLEKAPFEVKIVVAGNHELTLDERFYEEKGARWKWPAPQSPRGCMKLLRESKTIAYLENESTTVCLKEPSGTQTRLKAFEYQEQDAQGRWARIPDDVDVVVTHTPPRGHCDAATKDERSGCPALLRRLAEVKPLLHVCGHIHEARGIERVQWSLSGSDSLVDSVEHWQDPGRGNKKLSLLDLTLKSGRPLGNSASKTRQDVSNSLQRCQPGLSMPRFGVLQPAQDNLKSTSSLIGGALHESEAFGGIHGSGAMKQGRGAEPSRAALQGDLGFESRSSRYESAVINAAFLGPRMNGKMTGTNKAIVIDIDLPLSKVAGDV
ncbi:Metallo-dependent phosphatase [Lizonia empirigonia]|nr:Metallo-dependent phosphatase [Lizonia empirigonia]